jgi:DNA-binding MarR family transcriptional regulator
MILSARVDLLKNYLMNLRQDYVKMQITNEEHDLWLHLHQVINLLSRRQRELFAKKGISNEQYKILLTMATIAESNDGPIIITNLVPYMNRTLMSISAIIDRMDKVGFVGKVRDLSDRRTIRLQITPKGKRYLKKSAKYNMQVIKELSSTFSDEELHSLIILIKKVRNKLEELCSVDYKTEPNIVQSHKITETLNKLCEDL